ncbi:MAG: ABC transporter permease [Cyanobacteria bacterium P01_F01_bin.53]
MNNMKTDGDVAILAKEMVSRRKETGLRRAVRDSWLITGRNLMRLKRNPIVIVATVIFPMVFFLGFWMIGQKLFAAQGIDYIQYLLPVVNLQALYFSGFESAIMLAQDIESGMMQRCRAMPISRVAVVVGLVASYTVRGLLSTILLMRIASALGFRFSGGLIAALGYLFLVLIFTATCIMGFSVLALKLRKSTLVEAVAIVPYAPLVMLSNGFSPTENFPEWLQPFVRYQPVSVTCDALRALVAGSEGRFFSFGASSLWLAVLLLALGVWSVRLYRRLGSAV